MQSLYFTIRQAAVAQRDEVLPRLSKSGRAKSATRAVTAGDDKHTDSGLGYLNGKTQSVRYFLV